MWNFDHKQQFCVNCVNDAAKTCDRIDCLEHITTFGLKTTVTTVSSAIPASHGSHTAHTFASLASKWLFPTMISTLRLVVLRVSSSQGCLSLICCLSVQPVVSGVTSRTMTSPLGCRAEIFIFAASPWLTDRLGSGTRSHHVTFRHLIRSNIQHDRLPEVRSVSLSSLKVGEVGCFIAPITSKLMIFCISLTTWIDIGLV